MGLARILYFDCFNGASGDMVLGALLDAGLPLEELRRALGSLAIDGATVSSTKVLRAGVSATKFVVDEHEPNHHHHHAPTAVPPIATAIGRSRRSAGLSNGRPYRPPRSSAPDNSSSVSARSKRPFTRCRSSRFISMKWRPRFDYRHRRRRVRDGVVRRHRVVSSPLNVGGGMVESAHGTFPVPAPATVKLLGGVHRLLIRHSERARDAHGRAVGHGLRDLLRTRARHDGREIGYGAGNRDLPGTPNVLRVLVGEASEQAGTEQIVVINCEIDDMNPQLFGLVMDRLYAAGALEVYLAPVQMKKNRPGTLLTFLERPDRQELSSIVFHETTTIGVRYHEVTRERLDREIVAVATPYGEVRFKVARLGGRIVNASPDFEDCLRLASERKVPVKDVQAVASKAYLDSRDH